MAWLVGTTRPLTCFSPSEAKASDEGRPEVDDSPVRLRHFDKRVPTERSPSRLCSPLNRVRR